MMHMVNIIIAMVIGSVVTAILTFVLGNIFDRANKPKPPSRQLRTRPLAQMPTPPVAPTPAAEATTGTVSIVSLSPELRIL